MRESAPPTSAKTSFRRSRYHVRLLLTIACGWERNGTKCTTQKGRRSLRLRVERRRFPRADSGRQPVAQLATYTWQIRYDMQYYNRSPVQATRAFRTAVRLAPHSLAALRNLAASLGKAEDLEAASSAYTKASVARVDD
jgi:hypothetical protein